LINSNFICFVLYWFIILPIAADRAEPTYLSTSFGLHAGLFLQCQNISSSWNPVKGEIYFSIRSLSTSVMKGCGVNYAVPTVEQEEKGTLNQLNQSNIEICLLTYFVDGILGSTSSQQTVLRTTWWARYQHLMIIAKGLSHDCNHCTYSMSTHLAV
jgi:hypothetical protein